MRELGKDVAIEYAKDSAIYARHILKEVNDKTMKVMLHNIQNLSCMA